MKYPDAANLGTVLIDEVLLAAEGRNGAVAAAGVLPVGARPPARSQGLRACADYSEEAIPERDPAYRLPDATLHETQTVEHVPAAERLVLARCLEQFGMSRPRAAILAGL